MIIIALCKCFIFSQKVTAQLASIRGLLQKLEQIHSYLTKVVEGKMPSNHQVMYHLQDALSLVPDLIPLTKSFHIETHDQEMVGIVIFLILQLEVF